MSIKTFTPLLTNTLSLGFCSSSSPIWYCRPEQPPPTTRIRRAYFSCISAGVSSRILEAAASVMVIIFILLCPKYPQGTHTTYASGNGIWLAAIGTMTRHHICAVNVPYVLGKFKWTLIMDEPPGRLTDLTTFTLQATS